jgi:Protein of unknown function (DUF3429)
MRATPELEPRDVPQPAWLLGAAGLIPFVGLAALPVLDVIPAIPANYYFQLYAAVILSFLGGVHWGLAMQSGAPLRSLHLVVSVIPALIAWGALGLALRPALSVLAVAFAALFAFDAWSARAGWVPAWYPRLRLPLTAIVVACIALKWIGAP